MRIISMPLLIGLTLVSAQLDAQGSRRVRPASPEQAPRKSEVETRETTKPKLVPTPDGGFQVIFSPEGAHLEEVIALWSKSTGHKFSPFPNSYRGKASVHLEGVSYIKQEDVHWFFQDLIVGHEFALVPIGPKDAHTWRLEPFAASRMLKQRATFVPSSEVAALIREPARVFATSFTLKEALASDVARALQSVLSSRQVEFVQAVNSSNTVIVYAFGPTVAAIAQLVKDLDQPLPDKIKKRQEANNAKRR